MSRETTFWSVFTALALAALLALYAQDQGFFETESDQASPSENETAPPVVNSSLNQTTEHILRRSISGPGSLLGLMYSKYYQLSHL